jgi:hypothetical protein
VRCWWENVIFGLVEEKKQRFGFWTGYKTTYNLFQPALKPFKARETYTGKTGNRKRNFHCEIFTRKYQTIIKFYMKKNKVIMKVIALFLIAASVPVYTLAGALEDFKALNYSYSEKKCFASKKEPACRQGRKVK